MAMMKKMKVHRNIALPLIFMMRFFPVVRNEFSEIIDSLKLRGLLSFRKPFVTMEYLFVPMMFSSSKIAEELAAASEVRGISANGKHTSRREIKFRKITSEEQKYFKLKDINMVVVIETHAYLSNGTLFQYETIIHHPEKFTFTAIAKR